MMDIPFLKDVLLPPLLEGPCSYTEADNMLHSLWIRYRDTYSHRKSIRKQVYLFSLQSLRDHL